MAETFSRPGRNAIVRDAPALQEAVQDITAVSDGLSGYPGDVGKAADCQRVVDAAVADLTYRHSVNAGTSVRGPFLSKRTTPGRRTLLKVFAHIRLCGW
jgi:hypothetical protein